MPKLLSKSLLSSQQLSRQEILDYFKRADLFRKQKNAPPKLDKSVVTFFYENSTRTRISFEQAAKRLGCNTVHFSSAGSSVAKGESLLDSAKTVLAYGGDCIVVRHPASGSSAFLSEKLSVPVINAGDGINDHPSQGLLDAYTLFREWGENFSTRSVVIIGDIAHSRVARANIHILSALGAKIILCAPFSMVPMGIPLRLVKVVPHLDLALKEADAVICLRIQNERMGLKPFPSTHEFRFHWGLTRERLKVAEKNILILHPGPVNPGVEMDPDVMSCEQSKILDQVENGLFVRMAILNNILSEGRVK